MIVAARRKKGILGLLGLGQDGSYPSQEDAYAQMQQIETSGAYYPSVTSTWPTATDSGGSNWDKLLQGIVSGAATTAEKVALQQSAYSVPKGTYYDARTGVTYALPAGSSYGSGVFGQGMDLSSMMPMILLLGGGLVLLSAMKH